MNVLQGRVNLGASGQEAGCWGGEGQARKRYSAVLEKSASKTKENI